MIKAIAFDLVGVLVSKSGNDITKEQAKLEQLFNNNINEDLWLDKIREAYLDVFNQLYSIKNPGLISYLRKEYPKVKIVIASNHTSYIKDYLEKHFKPEDIFLSSVIGIAKPSPDFFKYLLKKLDLKPEELLFLDDKDGNVNSSKSLGINTIKVYNDTNIIGEIEKYMV